MNGVIKEIQCSSLKEFEKELESNLDNVTDFVFRGQYNALWPLDTSFQRFLRQVSKISVAAEENPFNDILECYKKLFDKTEKRQNFQEIDDYAGIGQHNGLPTPFMDWTETVNKALFFATCDEITNPMKHHRIAIYALRNKNVDELVNKKELKKLINNRNGFKLFEEFGLYLIDPNPKLPNPRVDCQNGVFLKIDGSENLNDDLIKIFSKAYSWYSFDNPIIYKFTLPRKLSGNILKELHHKSYINFGSIYPDLEGIAKQAKFEFIIDYNR